MSGAQQTDAILLQAVPQAGLRGTFAALEARHQLAEWNKKLRVQFLRVDRDDAGQQQTTKSGCGVHTKLVVAERDAPGRSYWPGVPHVELSQNHRAEA